MLLLPTRHELPGLALQMLKVFGWLRGQLGTALTSGLMVSLSCKHCCVRSVWTFNMSLRTLPLACLGHESASRSASNHTTFARHNHKHKSFLLT